MKPRYANEYSTFDYTYHGIHFLFEFTSPIITVVGDSGTGKTILYQAAKDTMNRYYYVKAFTKVDGNDIMTMVNAYDRYLFILDRADCYMTQELGESIIEAAIRGSKFLIFGRNVDIIPVFPCSLKEAVFDNNTITLRSYP